MALGARSWKSEAGRHLLALLDRFLEAAGRAGKRRALQKVGERLEDEAGKAFREQGTAFEGAVEDGADVAAATEAALSAGTPRMSRAVQVAVEGALEAGGQALAAEYGISFSLKNPRAVEYVRGYGAQLVTKVNDTTRAEIRDIVKRGTEEGWSYDQIAEEITDRFAEFAEGKPQLHIDSRAHLVAVTETGNAYEEGNRIVAQEMAAAGLTMEKKWLTVGDDRVSEGCRTIEAAGWIPLDEQFPSGHERPLRFPGCRCDCLYRRVRSEAK